MSKLKSKVITLNQRRTSIRLCNSEWCALDNLCKKEKISRKSLLESIEEHKSSELSLTGASRLVSLVYYYQLSENNKASPNQIISRLFKTTKDL